MDVLKNKLPYFVLTPLQKLVSFLNTEKPIFLISLPPYAINVPIAMSRSSDLPLFHMLEIFSSIPF